MIEVLTPEMQAEYLANLHFAGYERFLASTDLAAAA
jgi:hypothetical protein